MATATTAPAVTTARGFRLGELAAPAVTAAVIRGTGHDRRGRCPADRAGATRRPARPSVRPGSRAGPGRRTAARHDGLSAAAPRTGGRRGAQDDPPPATRQPRARGLPADPGAAVV